MAKAEQVKQLIRSHFENNTDQFSTVALQVAAHEARQGHDVLAKEIRGMVDKSKSKGQVVRLNREFHDLIIEVPNKHRLQELISSKATVARIQRVLLEYRNKHKLQVHGLSHRRKLLLAGPPGTGKTMTASVLAGELHLPLYIILMDKLMTRFMGETGARLRQVFAVIQEHMGVYLFDEFDAIGAERASANDVGEMRRVLNAFLQFIEQDTSQSLIVTATNTPGALDKALFRRFDDVLHYERPDDTQIKALIETRLGPFKPKRIVWKTLLQEASGLSHAEITKSCEDTIKEAILSDQDQTSIARLSAMLKERRLAYGREAAE